MHISAKPRYRAFLIRLWEEDAGTPAWRFSLEDPHSGQKQGFVSFVSLVAFLEHEMRGEVPPSEGS